MRSTIRLVLQLLPWLLLAAILTARSTLPVERFRTGFMGELGPVELGTVLVLLVAIAVGAVLLKRRRQRPAQRLWYALVVAGCVYFAGEELSWGQHLAGWSTPESIARLNDQQETNLHNMSSWLDQKPRLALELWIVLAALLVVGRRLGGRREPLPDPWNWMLPGAACASAGLAVLLSRLPERLADLWPAAGQPPFDIRLAEVQELLIAVHLLSYLWFASVRASDPDQATDPVPGRG